MRSRLVEFLAYVEKLSRRWLRISFGALAMNTTRRMHGYSDTRWCKSGGTGRSSSLKMRYAGVFESRISPANTYVHTNLPTYLPKVQVNYYERASRVRARKTIPGFAPDHLRGKSLCFSLSLRPPRRRISLVRQNFLSVEIGNTKCIVEMHNAPRVMKYVSQSMTYM